MVKIFHKKDGNVIIDSYSNSGFCEEKEQIVITDVQFEKLILLMSNTIWVQIVTSEPET